MQLFENIVGNEHIKESLQNAVLSGSVSHSYLFVGKAGIGKKLFARDLAKKVMCLGEDDCESCTKFDSNSNPDFSIIVPDGKSIKIEQIRNMQSRIVEKPIISSKKVYIIDDADLMSEESQNCLLKTLEEPPEYAMIILIASNENRMLHVYKDVSVEMTSETEGEEVEYGDKIIYNLEITCNSDILPTLKEYYNGNSKLSFNI